MKGQEDPEQDSGDGAYSFPVDLSPLVNYHNHLR
jgi:hypothetical protein